MQLVEMLLMLVLTKDPEARRILQLPCAAASLTNAPHRHFLIKVGSQLQTTDFCLMVCST